MRILTSVWKVDFDAVVDSFAASLFLFRTPYASTAVIEIFHIFLIGANLRALPACQRICLQAKGQHGEDFHFVVEKKAYSLHSCCKNGFRI